MYILENINKKEYQTILENLIIQNQEGKENNVLNSQDYLFYFYENRRIVRMFKYKIIKKYNVNIPEIKGILDAIEYKLEDITENIINTENYYHGNKTMTKTVKKNQ
jgi:hypothetical protein